MTDLLNNSSDSSSVPSAAAAATVSNPTSTANGEASNSQTSANIVISTAIFNDSVDNRSANKPLLSPIDQKCSNSAIVKTKSMLENLNGIDLEEAAVGQSAQTAEAANSDQKTSFMTRLPWGAIKDKHSNSNSSSIYEVVGVDRKKPGEYLMHLIVLNFIQLSSKKFEQIINGEKRVSYYKK
jgi:hypothetical protein